MTGTASVEIIFSAAITSCKAGIAAEIGLLLLLIAVPPLREVFGLEPLTLREWPLLLLFPPTMLLLEEARKALLRLRGVTPPPAAPDTRGARRCS